MTSLKKSIGPTPWVSPIVTPPKPNNPEEIRICVDMRHANKAIQRERHICPTLDDMIHALKWCNSVFQTRSKQRLSPDRT